VTTGKSLFTRQKKRLRDDRHLAPRSSMPRAGGSTGPSATPPVWPSGRERVGTAKDITAVGRETANRGTDLVMSNHQSHYDVAVLFRVTRARTHRPWSEKREALRDPVLFASDSDSAVRSGRPGKTHRARVRELEEVKGRALGRRRSAIAPEGTRSATGEPLVQERRLVSAIEFGRCRAFRHHPRDARRDPAKGARSRGRRRVKRDVIVRSSRDASQPSTRSAGARPRWRSRLQPEAALIFPPRHTRALYS